MILDPLRQVAPVPIDKVSQVESEIGFLALPDNGVQDCERHVWLRRSTLHAAHCQARGYLPSDRLVQLFQGICDFTGCVDYLDQGEVPDSVDHVVLDLPLSLSDRVWRNRRVISRRIDAWWFGLHVVSPKTHESSTAVCA